MPIPNTAATLWQHSNSVTIDVKLLNKVWDHCQAAYYKPLNGYICRTNSYSVDQWTTSESTESSITVYRLIERRFWLPTWYKARIAEQWKMVTTRRVDERQLVCKRRLHIHRSNWCHVVWGSDTVVDLTASRYVGVQECCWRTHRGARVTLRRWAWGRPDGRQLPTVWRTQLLCPEKPHSTLDISTSVFFSQLY